MMGKTREGEILAENYQDLFGKDYEWELSTHMWEQIQ